MTHDEVSELDQVVSRHGEVRGPNKAGAKLILAAHGDLVGNNDPLITQARHQSRGQKRGLAQHRGWGLGVVVEGEGCSYSGCKESAFCQFVPGCRGNLVGENGWRQAGVSPGSLISP